MPTTASSSISDAQEPNRTRRSAWVALAIGALAAALLSLLIGPWLRQGLFDQWQRLAPRTLGNDVTVVMIDDPAVREIGAWPWPRNDVARLLLAIDRFKPKVVAFDILFAEPDRFNPDQLARHYPQMDDATRAGIGRLGSLDADLAGVIGQAPVLLARSGIESRAFGVASSDPAQLLVDPEMKGTPPPRIHAWPRVVTSIPELDDTALAHGFINGVADKDGVYRRVPVGILVGKRAMPGMAAELARIASGAEAVEWGKGEARIGKITLPVEDTATLPLRFAPFPESRVISASTVMAQGSPKDEQALAANLTGKVVLVGLGTEGSVDLVKTPLAMVYGITVQAQAVDAMLHHGWLVRPDWLEAGEWLLGLALAGLLGIGSLKRRWPFLVAGAGTAALVPVSLAVFVQPGVLFDPLRPLVIVIGASLAAGGRALRAARAERTRLAAELLARQMASAVQEGELQAARGIQLGMVPARDKLARLDPRLDAAAALEPARSVGGDFFDAFRIDADRVLFVIADVTGKGVPAALFMAVSKTLAKSVLVREKGGLAHAMETLNSELLREADDSMGVTMLVVLADCATGTMTMVNAGHENPLIVRSDGAVEVLPMEGGPPFCVVEFPYPEEELRLARGEKLVLITDGVTEAQNEAGELFGIEGALQWLGASGRSDAATIVPGLMRAVRTFEEPAEPADDLTVMAIEWRGA